MWFAASNLKNQSRGIKDTLYNQIKNYVVPYLKNKQNIKSSYDMNLVGQVI